jgi:hypothetical protein
LKSLYQEEDSEPSDNERRKKLYIMYGGSWGLTSRREVKALRREVLAAAPGAPKAAPHQKWVSTTISFGPADCPDNMAGAGMLPVIVSPVIANIQLHHVLIDGGAALSVISHAAFKQLQIPESKLTPSRPFSGVGRDPVWPLGSIDLPVTFGTKENFRTETVRFDVAEVNLPFNAIIGRPALYRFMAVAHYGYLVLKMPSPAGILTVPGDRSAAVAAVERLYAFTTDAAQPEGSGPSASGTKVSGKPPKVPRLHSSDPDDVAVKTVQIGSDLSQTTLVAGNLGEK